MMAIVQNEDILHWKWKGQREKCSGTQVRIVLRNSTVICVFDHAAQRRRPGDASRRQPDLYHCVISGAAVLYSGDCISEGLYGAAALSASRSARGCALSCFWRG